MILFGGDLRAFSRRPWHATAERQAFIPEFRFALKGEGYQQGFAFAKENLLDRWGHAGEKLELRLGVCYVQPDTECEEHFERTGMKTEVTEVGPCKVRIQIEVPAEAVKERIDRRYRELSENVVIPGFRKGKVPRRLLERRFGSEIAEEIKGALLQESYEKLLEEKNLEPLARPDVDLEKVKLADAEPLQFDFTVEVRPEVKVEGYTGLRAKRPKIEVSGAEIDQGIERLRESRAELLDLPEGEVSRGDLIMADLVVTSDAKEVTRQESVVLTVLPDLKIFGAAAPELYAKLLGARRAERRELEFRISETFEKVEFRGKSALLVLDIREVKRKKVPELSEEWAKELDFPSLEELRAEITRRIQRAKSDEADRVVEEELLDQLRKRTTFPLPERLVDEYLQSQGEKLRLELSLRQVPEDEIEKALEDFQKKSRDMVADRMKGELILDEIARKEKLFVTEQEVDGAISVMASAYRKWPTELKTHYEQTGQLSQLRSSLRRLKVLKFLKEKAAIEGEP